MPGLLSLDPVLIVVVVAVMLFAGLVHGTLGLGFPMVATPILAIFFDVRSAILLTLLPTVAVNVVSIWHSPDSVENVRRFFPLIAFSLLGALIGALILASVDPSPFRIVLAALIALYLVSNRIGRIRGDWLQQNLFAAMVLFGLVAGLSAGTTNVMVAVLIIFFLALETPRESMVPALNSCFLMGKLAQIVVLSFAGFVTWTLLAETSPLALVGVAALLAGQRIRASIPVDTYRRVLHGLLVLLAVVLIAQFVAE
ncbi:MAG: sulfite exporter TauE/SafE family protein [Pseudomonadota bacterium]